MLRPGTWKRDWIERHSLLEILILYHGINEAALRALPCVIRAGSSTNRNERPLTVSCS